MRILPLTGKYLPCFILDIGIHGRVLFRNLKIEFCLKLEKVKATRNYILPQVGHVHFEMTST